MQVWITKYALTKGVILVEDAEDCGDEYATRMIRCPSLGSFAVFHGEGKEWHKTKESAIAKAEEMRTKAIAAHLKGIAKLEKMRF
jgi:hypothetical protein